MRTLYRRWIEQWDHRLANVSTDRVVRPFEWGEDWTMDWPFPVTPNGHQSRGAELLQDFSRQIVADSDRFYAYEVPRDFRLEGDLVQFTSAAPSPYPTNNRVKARWFPAVDKRTGQPSKKAVVVLPHWNSQEGAHVGLCKMIQKLGISALRLSLPYHDRRMPPELHRADYAVSSNVGRTVAATRQAVIDIRSCFDWLQQTGHSRLGIVGTSLGSCYAFLASAHDARIEVNAFNHCSAYFADVVWTGMATRHIRASLDTSIDLDTLRECWMGISPAPYIRKFGQHEHKQSLFIYAKYDTSFLPEFTHAILDDIKRYCRHHRVAVLPCGHYTTGEAPYKYIDGFYIGRFLAGAFKDRSAG